MANVFISIIMASCRPQNLRAFFDDIIKKADKPNSFEVLIKVDKEDPTTCELVAQYQKEAPFAIKYIITPKRKGAYSMHTDYNRLLRLTHKDSYFCLNLTDEIRFKTKGWDTIITSYMKLFPDDIFRLEISNNKSRNYYELNDCLYRPDNYPAITKKWLYLTGGWGDYWGTDTWQGVLNFHLGRGSENADRSAEFFRSIPIFDIQIEGDEAGKNESKEAATKRERMALNSFAILSSRAAQENFLRLALRLRAHIIANQHKLSTYQIKENFYRKTLSLIVDNKIIHEFSFKYNFEKQEEEKNKITFFDKVKNLLRISYCNKYNASQITDIIPSNYGSILKQINALE